jgi:hypothetical protein
MALTRNIGRIDHVVITVSPKNFQPCIEKLTRMLGLKFQGPIYRKAENTQAAVDWDSGMEVLAPITEEGMLWEQLKVRGEGYMSVVFGVANLDKAREQAAAAGVQPLFDVGLNGDEPWFDRFDVVKETLLEPVFGATIVLGEIIPKT